MTSGLLHATVFNVGTGKKYQKISQVPFDELLPGDMVKIHYRKSPYKENIVLNQSGTKERPIVILGISKNGKRPVIDGSSAIQTKRQMPSHFGRGLITIGDQSPANYVIVKNLNLQDANNSKGYYLDGKLIQYKDNVAGIFVWKGKHVTVSDCKISSCGNGILSNAAPDVVHLTINRCLIYNNGNHRDPYGSQEHNIYIQGKESIVQFCRFGPLISDGQNLKDRGHKTIIRYNWIEGGMSRQLDLVDRIEYKNAHAYVYGNVIVQGRKIRNHNMIHWGGDSGYSRSGTLFFFNNTVIGKAIDTRFIITRYADCKLYMINNVFIGSGFLWNGVGGITASHNWISNNIRMPLGHSGAIKGNQPFFISAHGIPYLPGINSPLVDSGANHLLPKVKYMPLPTGGGLRRPRLGAIDIGAFESGAFWFKKRRSRKNNN